MTLRWYWNRETDETYWFSLETGIIDGTNRLHEPNRVVQKNSLLPCPNIMRDTAGYKSPVGTGWIEGRTARREDLKRNGCREVEPSEFKPKYHNKRFADKNGLQHSGDYVKKEKPFVLPKELQ